MRSWPETLAMRATKRPFGESTSSAPGGAGSAP